MANPYSANDLLDFLEHASSRGLIPAATATALSVASRNVLGVLNDEEKQDLSQQDLDSVIRRFTNKRAKDFSPSSLKEYGRRLHRAIGLYLRWRDDPSNFSVKTRATSNSRRRDRNQGSDTDREFDEDPAPTLGPAKPGTYNSSVPVRSGVVITIANVLFDLTAVEAERIATFVRMLAVGPTDAA